jgi:hypothetical protein
MGDLVIKLRSSDETGPGVNAARQGMAKLAETAEVMAQKVQRSWKPTGGAFGDLRGASQAAARRMVEEAARTGSADDVEMMGRRMQLYERSASAYERSVGTQLQALARLSLAEEDAYEQSSVMLHHNISTKEQLLNRAAGRSMTRAATVSRNASGSMQEAIFGLDDAMTGFANNGWKGAMMGAGNNITMVAAQLGSVKAQLLAVGAVAAFQLGVTLYNKLQQVRDGAKQLREELDGVRKSASRIGDGNIQLRHIDDEVEGMSSKKILQQQADSKLTVARSSEVITALEAQAAQAEKLVRQADNMNPRAGTGIAWKDDEERKQFRKSAIEEAETISRKIDAARNTQRSAQEFLSFTKKNNSVAAALAREEEAAALAREEEAAALAREEEAAAKKRGDAEEKIEREVTRKRKLLDKLAKEVKGQAQKMEDFRLKAFGGQGAEQSVLAKLSGDMQEARELLKGGELQQAEAQLTRAAEEKLAKLSLAQRPEFRETKNPALALANSDRARQIVLGAGNQMLDAKTKLDKHQSAMEQMTAQVAAGIKEMVEEAKRDIEVFVARD